MHRALLGTLLSLTLSLAPASAWAKEKLVWLLRDLPPLTIFEGPEKGRGAVDQMLTLLIAQLPEYEHSVLRVNRARALQMLQQGVFACDPTLLWTQERARFVVYSVPSIGTLSNGLIIRKSSSALLAPFLKDGQVDLQALLTHGNVKLGMVGGRSYSTVIDDILATVPAALSPHYGDNAVASLMQMQQLGRLPMLLGYWTEVRYLGERQNIALQDIAYYPIQGVERYQFVHVGCSDTALGREAIARINPLLRQWREELLPPLYGHWMEPEVREAYLRDAHGFFIGPDRR